MKNKNWIFILIGGILIIIAASIFFYSNPGFLLGLFPNSLTIDQEGFAPIFLPSSDGIPAKTYDSINIPEWIRIPAIDLEAPVIPAVAVEVKVDETNVVQYLVPEKFAAGWHENSAPLGVTGNTVISGHHNAYGKVFENLVDLRKGDEIVMLSDNKQFSYKVAARLILPEKDQPLSVRMENARWMLPSDDERITLITCWPRNSNTHRLVLVALPS